MPTHTIHDHTIAQTSTGFSTAAPTPTTTRSSSGSPAGPAAPPSSVRAWMHASCRPSLLHRTTNPPPPHTHSPSPGNSALCGERPLLRERGRGRHGLQPLLLEQQRQHPLGRPARRYVVCWASWWCNGGSARGVANADPPPPVPQTPGHGRRGLLLRGQAGLYRRRGRGGRVPVPIPPGRQAPSLFSPSSDDADNASAIRLRADGRQIVRPPDVLHAHYTGLLPRQPGAAGPPLLHLWGEVRCVVLLQEGQPHIRLGRSTFSRRPPPCSYGGHYAPAAAYRVWEGNARPAAGDVHINLKVQARRKRERVGSTAWERGLTALHLHTPFLGLFPPHTGRRRGQRPDRPGGPVPLLRSVFLGARPPANDRRQTDRHTHTRHD